MYRCIVVLATSLVATVACSDSLPNLSGPEAPADQIALDAEVGVVNIPPGASSLCASSLRSLALVEAKLVRSPSDSALKAAKAAQTEISSDVCN